MVSTQVVSTTNVNDAPSSGIRSLLPFDIEATLSPSGSSPKELIAFFQNVCTQYARINASLPDMVQKAETALSNWVEKEEAVDGLEYNFILGHNWEDEGKTNEKQREAITHNNLRSDEGYVVATDERDEARTNYRTVQAAIEVCTNHLSMLRSQMDFTRSHLESLTTSSR